MDENSTVRGIMKRSVTSCKCGTAAVTHKTTDVKVLSGKSSNPTSSHIFFWQIMVIYSHRYITLGW